MQRKAAKSRLTALPATHIDLHSFPHRQGQRPTAGGPLPAGGVGALSGLSPLNGCLARVGEEAAAQGAVGRWPGPLRGLIPGRVGGGGAG